MVHDPRTLQSIVEGAAPPDLELGFRAMFGGIMAYAGGKPFASLSDVGLALKFAGPDHAAFAVLPGVVPLRYEPDAPASKSYLVATQAILDNAAELRGWIARSVAGLPAAKARKR